MKKREIGTQHSMISGGRAAACSERQGLPVSPGTVGTRAPRTWDGRLATVVSTVGSPPIMASAALLMTALAISSSTVWKWLGIHLVIGVMTPFSYVVWLVKRGDVTDIDVQLRKQRTQPLLVTILCTGVAWLVLLLGNAPATMSLIAGAVWLEVVTIFAITLRWKISVHAATAAGAATIASALMGNPFPFLITVPLVAWSRIHLRHHTLPQTVVGALLGSIVFFAATRLPPWGW